MEILRGYTKSGRPSADTAENCNVIHVVNKRRKVSLKKLSMDRFSLLLLEPHEIYFSDVAVTLYRDANKAPNAEGNFSRGRLKICSKSIVYVPKGEPGQSNMEPLLKFPLSDCSEIAGTFSFTRISKKYSLNYFKF